MSKVFAAGIFLALSASSVFAAEKFTWTGSYEGYFVCDHIENGIASTFGRAFELHIVQEDNVLNISTGSAEQLESGEGVSLYHGLVMKSPNSEFSAGFLEACNPRFPYKELVRFFPASTRDEGFSFSASTTFISDGLPGSEGALVVESCKWSATRVSTTEPEIQRCDTAPSAR